MRRLTEFEKALYRNAAGEAAPFCLVLRWPWWFRGFTGFTLGIAIFVKHEHPALICHEVVHVAQFRSQPLTFWLRYVRELLRVGYRDNRFECAAREVGARVAQLTSADIRHPHRSDTDAAPASRR